MFKNTLTLIASVILLLLAFWVTDTNIKNSLIEISINLFVVFLIALFILFPKKSEELKMYWKTKLMNRQKKVRFSMSYLYKIQIDDKYLLVKSSKWNQFQLVGGKYKKFNTANPFLEKLGVFDDIKMPQKGMSKNDLALFLPAPNTSIFLNWFDTAKDRELSHWREFHEELISTGILSQENFPYVNYKFVCSITSPLQISETFNCLEILHYDILELVPTIEQEIELRRLLVNNNSEKYRWASYEEINKKWGSGHHGSSYQIGKHTKWAINQKWSKEHDPILD